MPPQPQKRSSAVNARAASIAPASLPTGLAVWDRRCWPGQAAAGREHYHTGLAQREGMKRVVAKADLVTEMYQSGELETLVNNAASKEGEAAPGATPA